MIIEPEKYIDAFIDAGAGWLSVHQEAVTHLNRTINYIKNKGVKAGVALNPATPLDSLEFILEYLDFVLIMSVNPGFGGQEFIPNSLRKIKELRNMADKLNPDLIIEVDGGVTTENIKEIYSAGARMMVSGSGIFGTVSAEETISEMRKLCGAK
jgi:ribulose-phosphate 3-epimerase